MNRQKQTDIEKKVVERSLIDKITDRQTIVRHTHTHTQTFISFLFQDGDDNDNDSDGDDDGDSSSTSTSPSPPCLAEYLLTRVERQLTAAKTNLLKAARNTPIHGTLQVYFLLSSSQFKYNLIVS